MMLVSPWLVFAGCAACFLIGLAAGYAANRSGAVWRRRFIVERDYYAAYRDQSEALVQEKLRRIARLEAAVVEAEAIAPPEPGRAAEAFIAPPPQPQPQPQTPPAATPAPATGPLARLRGMTPELRAALDALGIRTLRDIERLSGEDELALELRLNLPAGYIARHQWRLQAALLDEPEGGV